MAKTNENAPVGPWRGGRPSFKAFYPELIFLTVVTIAFIALAARLSCSGTKATSKNAEPTPVSSATLFSAPQAFAQDVSLDATSPTEETTASQADDGVIAPVETVASEAEAQTENAASQPETQTEDAASQPETQPENAASQPETQTENAASQPAKSESSVKILAIWGVCLAIPALLWIWRVSNWIVAVYGVRYEIRCDADNPKATTILVTRGIFNKKTDSMHIAQVKDIQSSQTFFQKYFQGGVGTISLFTQDLTDGVLQMKNMEDPSRVFNALDELRRRYWALGGVGGLGAQGGVSELENLEGMNDAV